ncbi:hypothetical protein H4CHR_02909 [Variovorax sp. PBS-H4]|nr:hypothetical protein H4CHR_02909 [Variovorax sp. PBS-H4]
MKLGRPSPAPKGAPREPLFTLPEVADRLKYPTTRLTAALRHYPGLQCAMNVGSSSSARPRQRLYAMSAVRAWWATVPAHLKESRATRTTTHSESPSQGEGLS